MLSQHPLPPPSTTPGIQRGSIVNTVSLAILDSMPAYNSSKHARSVGLTYVLMHCSMQNMGYELTWYVRELWIRRRRRVQTWIVSVRWLWRHSIRRGSWWVWSRLRMGFYIRAAVKPVQSRGKFDGWCGSVFIRVIQGRDLFFYQNPPKRLDFIAP